MKFLCLDCDEPMKLHSTEGPQEGSLSVTFRCPECGFRVAMLTNPFETQMVKSLGVSIGGRSQPPAPFERLRASMAGGRGDAFEDQRVSNAAEAESGEVGGSGCPFAAALAGESTVQSLGNPAAEPTGVTWAPEAEARLERVPSFIRSMAKRSIERFAEGKGYPTVTEAVMDEARAVFGM